MVLAQRDLTTEVRRLVIQERQQLETYLEQHPEFLSTLSPWPRDPYAPPLVRDMIEAAISAGVGPMAAVAGAIAARVGQALRAFTDEVIVENGGDIFMHLIGPATVSLYAGRSPLSHKVGLKISPDRETWGVCTSSGTVGHSLSLGRCDLATVVGESGALADAVATLAGNSVQSESDIEGALSRVMEIDGVRGVLLVKGERIGLAGNLPRLVRNRDRGLGGKVTRFPA